MKKLFFAFTATLAVTTLFSPMAQATEEPPPRQEQNGGTMEQRASEIGRKLDELDLRMKEAADETKATFAREMAELRRQETVIRDKMREMRGTSGKVWKEMKEGTEKALDELQQSYDRAREQFNP